jgi:uncharacterized coiled-coil protein SlyX
MVYRGLPENFPAPVEGEIVLCADDGFILRKDSTADYLRQTFVGGVLTLTNTPEPEPVEEVEPIDPEPSLDERVTNLEGQLAQSDETAIELYEAMAAQEEINTAQDEALIAIYEMIGG